MNLPNKITFTRILLIPLFLIFMIPLPEWTNRYEVLNTFNLFVQNYGDLVASIIFALTAITDGVDGYIARKYKMTTNLGIFLDPLADKLMVSAALIALVQINKISAWIAIIIIAREFTITGFRILASDKNIVLAADKWGKMKTAAQIIFVLGAISLHNDIIILVLGLVAMLLTVYSGWNYISKHRNILD